MRPLNFAADDAELQDRLGEILMTSGAINLADVMACASDVFPNLRLHPIDAVRGFARAALHEFYLDNGFDPTEADLAVSEDRSID